MSNSRRLKVIPETIACNGKSGRLWRFPQISVDQTQIVDGWIEVKGLMIEFEICIKEPGDSGKNLGYQRYSEAHLGRNKVETNCYTDIYQLDDMNFTLPKSAIIEVIGRTIGRTIGCPDYTLVFKYL